MHFCNPLSGVKNNLSVSIISSYINYKKIIEIDMIPEINNIKSESLLMNISEIKI